MSRLDPRSVVAAGVLALGVGLAGGVPTLVGIGVNSPGFGVAASIVVLALAALVVLAVLAERFRLSRTWYRVGPDQVELHGGLVVRHDRSVARERIRSVEITADPVLRVLGLAVVRIGTGVASDEKPLELRALRRGAAETLRRRLLESAAPRTGGVLARWSPAWLRYAPLSGLSVLLGLVVPGALVKTSDAVGLQDRLVRAVGALVTDAGVLVAVGGGMAVVLVVGAVASVVVRAEAWWNLRLEREPGGTVRVTRGLLTLRSTTLDERRLHGVVVAEPLGGRIAGAARLDAVATGLSTASSRGDERRSDPKELMPPAPRALVDRVAGDVLGEPVAPWSTVAWRAHPDAAGRRRVRWSLTAALIPAVVVAVVLVTFGPVLPAVAVLVLGAVAGLAWGRAGSAALAHGVVGPWLVVRSGVGCRRTVVLHRGAVIGWSVARTPFQRRAGLVTVRLTTAAGDGCYAVRDVGEAEALSLVDEVLGGHLVPG